MSDARQSLTRVIVVACAVQQLPAPAAYGQSDGCAVDASDRSELCVANVIRVPPETHAVCDTDGEKALAERDQLASEARDKQAARQRLAEARMNDAEKTIPDDHTSLEENFAAARTRDAEAMASEKRLRVSEAPDACSENGAPLMPLTREDSVEIAFRAPPSCLRTLQRALGGEVPVLIERLASRPPDHAVAQLIEVVTIIEGDAGMVQARAIIDRPSIALQDDDQVLVRLRCSQQ